MSSEEKKGLSYREQFLTPAEVVKHIHVPKDPKKIPHVVSILAPVRSGTTASTILMAGQKKVDRIYEQPMKTILRYGPDKYGGLTLHEEDDLVVIKETFGPFQDEELFDPIRMLLDAGVPIEKQTILMTIRDPLALFQSAKSIASIVEARYFARMIMHTINMYHRYKTMYPQANIVPFSYDLLGHQDGVQKVIDALCKKMGLDSGMSLHFDKAAFLRKAELYEGNDPEYYKDIFEPVLKHGEFKYVPHSKKETGYTLTDDDRAELADCFKAYLAFTDMARRELNLLPFR